MLSEDSAICQVVGSDSTQIFKHIYIRSSVSHNNKQYTVTGIADNAFKYNNLESLSLPQTLQTIGNNAFLGCQKLQFVDIPDCVTTIGSQSFWLCRSMSSLRLPSGIKEIPSGAFSFTNMENVVVPEGVTTIGCDAFAANERLVNVSLPKSLQSLERGVFWKCKALKTITIPENVREIGILAFYDRLRSAYRHLQPFACSAECEQDIQSRHACHCPRSPWQCRTISQALCVEINDYSRENLLIMDKNSTTCQYFSCCMLLYSSNSFRHSSRPISSI